MNPSKLESPPSPPLGIDDTELIRRAVMFAGTQSPAADTPRWAIVRDLFQIGGGYAIRLCRRFGVDPDEPMRSR
ncbi:hypothetical protein GCM10011521_22120 [Arenimonas soli]|uniref:MarR family transcriptional regulator n=1 Tax=Arenimonas soli TaxID=2269504 RepID=A0ABQ1HNP7_9GAMM|nr:hypothetical protein [Arenimonas soli]GGA83355.1 hypothetical protein GCM10011521_22120 [Arenimonas soli]